MKYNFYKIFCDENELIYIGSTKMTIDKRLKKHKRDYKQYLKIGRAHV